MNPRKRRTVGIRCAAVVTLMLGATLQLAVTAHAQLVSGTIVGMVTDESRAVLPGVTATITSPALPGGPSSVVTDEHGRYRFAGLAPGTYTLKFALAGFAEYVEELRITAAATVERNASLAVATVVETVTVKGQSPMVDTRTAAVTATATREIMESVPTARTLLTDYMQLMSGVAATNPGGYNERVNIMGSPETETMHIHDGVHIYSTGWTGGDIDGTEEMQATSVGPSAEFASASGGVVNVVTKSGTNTFQGDAAAYWKSDQFQSRPIQLDCDCPDGTTGFHVQDERDFSAHLGGPLLRDRLWFFGGIFYYQYNHSEPGTWPEESTPAWWHRINGKITWQATRTAKVSGFLKNEPWGGYANGPSRSVTLEATRAWKDVHGLVYGGELNKTFGNNTVLTVRAGGTNGTGINTSLDDDLTTPSHTDNLTGIISNGVTQSFRWPNRRHDQSLKVDRYIAGPRVTHSLRGGFQHERSYTGGLRAFPSSVQYYDFGGAPDYALFQDHASVQSGSSTQMGGWGENQMTIGSRLTFSIGLRFDHVVGRSPDEDAVDAALNPTGGTIAGLGDVFTWNHWSPRVGVNTKLTADGRTVLRGTYSRVYRRVFTEEIEPLHPGTARTTEAFYNAATGTYSDIASVTDPRANIAIDGSLEAPVTNAFSIGVDRELVPQLALHTSYIFKDSKELIGWRDIRGVYGQSTAVLPDGRTLTTYPLLSPSIGRLFQRTNPPGWFDTYHGFVVGLDKRLANRWRAQANLTLSRSHGLRLTGNGGRDPNDLTNATGRLNPTDRPVMFNANATYEVPVIDVRFSTQYLDLSNVAYAPQAFVVLPQGRRAINIEAPGAFRGERVRLLNLQFSKILFPRGRRQLELLLTVDNVLQNQSTQASSGSFFTFNYFSPNYGEPVSFVQPRHMYLGARVRF